MERKSKTKVSIIVPIFRADRKPSEFDALIESCLNQEGVVFECILVSNISDSMLREHIHSKYSKEERIKYFEVCKIGVNRARHFGALRSEGEFLFFLDDDCELPREDFLFDLLLKISNLEKNSAIGGGYACREGGVFSRGYNSLVSAWILSGVCEKNGAEKKHLLQAENLVGGNFCIPREVYFQNPLDQSIVFGGDETDFFRKLRSVGVQIYYSETLLVYHNNRESLEKLIRRAWAHGSIKEKRNLNTDVRFRKKWDAWRQIFSIDKNILFVSLIHFPIVFLSGRIEKFKKLTESIGNVSAAEQAKYSNR
jgi:glycosyltransferase involved in cell wall biosynthesis